MIHVFPPCFLSYAVVAAVEGRSLLVSASVRRAYTGHQAYKVAADRNHIEGQWEEVVAARRWLAAWGMQSL